MALRIHLSPDGDRTLVVKCGAGLDAEDSLRAEAAWLQRLRHPGVVEFVELRQDDETTELVTVYAGSATLADLVFPDAGAVAGVMAGLASIIGDLHGAGASHRNLSADHVVLGSAHRPVICSFAAAGRADAQGVAADLAVLGSLTDALLAQCPTPSTRLARRQRRSALEALGLWRATSGSAGALAQLLAAVPGAASSGALTPPESEPTSGPSGQPMVVSSGALTPPESEPTSGPSGQPGATSTRTWRERVPPLPPTAATARKPNGPAAFAAAILAGVLVIAVGLALRPGPAKDAERPMGPAASTLPTIAPRPSDVGVAAVPARRACVILVERSCVDDVEVVGNMIRVAGRWFEAGEIGDVVELGDWDCDGALTPAVLRPATGDVFVFSQWADTAPVEVPAVARASGAVGLSGRPSESCDELYTIDADGLSSANPVVWR